jgi:quercetin dioxygenase-like cupin family protein
MSEHATSSADVIDVLPPELLTEGHRVDTLVKTPTFEVKRLLLSKGKEIPTHQAPGEITVQCVAGRIAFTAGGETHDLEAGRMLYLRAREPHSLVGLENSVVLVTKLAGASAGS